MAIVDADSRVVSATPDALAWFGDMESLQRIPDATLGRDVPSEVTVAAQEARARACPVPPSRRRARARTRSGLWLLIHASCLHHAAGRPRTPPS